jgi:hypothetical protein
VTVMSTRARVVSVPAVIVGVGLLAAAALSLRADATSAGSPAATPPVPADMLARFQDTQRPASALILVSASLKPAGVVLEPATRSSCTSSMSLPITSSPTPPANRR